MVLVDSESGIGSKSMMNRGTPETVHQLGGKCILRAVERRKQSAERRAEYLDKRIIIIQHMYNSGEGKGQDRCSRRWCGVGCRLGISENNGRAVIIINHLFKSTSNSLPEFIIRRSVPRLSI